MKADETLLQLSALVMNKLSEPGSWVILSMSAAWKGHSPAAWENEGRVMTIYNMETKQMFNIAIFPNTWSG